MTKPTPIDTGRDIVGFFLILFGSFVLFCAGIVAAMLLTVFVAEPGALVEWWIIAALVAFVGAAMVIGGRTLRGLSNETNELAYFAGNVLIAIGFGWISFTGLCTMILLPFAQPPQGTPGVLLSAIPPLAIGALVVIIGGALKYANTAK